MVRCLATGRGGALPPPAPPGVDRGFKRICRGRPMCRPGHGPSRDPPTGGHIGPPLRETGRRLGTNGNWCGTMPFPAGRDGARPLRGGAEAFAAGCGHPALRVQRRWCVAAGRCSRHRPLRPAGGREGGTPGSSCPTGGCGEPPRLPWPAAHSGAFAARSRGVGWNRSRDHPKGASNFGQSLSHGEAVTAPVAVPKILCSHALTEF